MNHQRLKLSHFPEKKPRLGKLTVMKAKAAVLNCRIWRSLKRISK